MNTAIFGAIGIGLLLGAIFILLPYPLLRFLNIPDDVIAIAIPYMQLYGAGTIILALNSVMLACLRTHGLTLQALIVPTIANILAVCGNYVVLFSPFGLPNFGVRGIAISGIFGQFCAGIVAIYLVKRYVKFNVLKVNFKRCSIPFLKQILKLGLPSSGESVSYSGAQVVVTMIVATLGTNVLITKSYVSAITQFVFLIGFSLMSRKSNYYWSYCWRQRFRRSISKRLSVNGAKCGNFNFNFNRDLYFYYANYAYLYK